MESYLYHSIADGEYCGIVTILDYEIQAREELAKVVLPACCIGKDILVDFALKAGMNKYRFVSFYVNDQGMLDLDSNHYVDVSAELTKTANALIQERVDILKNSILTEKQMQQIVFS